MHKDIIAIDTETTLISYPDSVCPDGVCLTTSRGEIYHMKLERDRLRAALQDWLRNFRIVGHNIAFDLHVILKQMPELWPDVWDALKAGRISDTMLRERLFLLSTMGNTAGKPCSLADLVLRHVGEDITAGKTGPDIWRLRYGELMDCPLDQWPEAATEYALSDAGYTLQVWQEQEKRRRPTGPGSMNSENIQVAAAFSLYGMTIEGMRIDQNTVQELYESTLKEYEETKKELQKSGIIKEDGKRNQKKLQEYCKEWGVTATTASGKVATSKEALSQIVSDDPVLATYRRYKLLEKPVTTYLPQMMFNRIHPSFNPIVNTLRTSCRSSNYYKYKGQPYGKNNTKMGHPVPSINLQNIPRDGGLRQAFVPEHGCCFIAIDYENLELVCAAQTYYSLFGKSSLRELLNSGTNMHDVTGTSIYCDYTGKTTTVAEFKELIAAGDKEAKFCRQAAKKVNLGCPGGQGVATIHRTANADGIKITLEQAEQWIGIAKNQFPEFRAFFENYMPSLHTGYMYVKQDGKVKKTQRYDAEICGVWRAKTTYCAIANSVSMQMPAALGKKLAMIKLYELCTRAELESPLYGCTLHLDLHDEFIFSVPLYKATECQRIIAEVMVDSMQKILPDMRVGVEAAIMHKWSKDPDPELGSIKFNKPPTREVVYE